MRVNIVRLKSNAVLPVYQSEHASGMDLHACLDEPVTIKPLERVMIPTGLIIELPAGYEAQIRARSGLSIKSGITMVNGVGTIDSDYRGEIGMLVINLGDEPFIVESGMRLAQMVITQFEHVIWNETQLVNETQRGSDAYGSTGAGI